MLLSFSKETTFIKQNLFGKVIKEERKRMGRRGVGKAGEGRPRYEESRESLDVGMQQRMYKGVGLIIE